MMLRLIAAICVLFIPLTRASAQPRITVNEVPMLRQSLDLQGASGIKAQRTDLIGGSRLSTGRLVLLDASQRALLYVDSAGRLTDVVRIGGEAEPFARPWWMGQCGKD